MTTAPHGSSIGTCVATFLALLALTAATVAAAHVDLGGWNHVLAVSLAGGKAALVAAFFMQVRRATSLVKATAAAGCVWLVVLIGLTMTDYLTRNW